MATIVANYEAQRQAFAELLTPGGKQRIVTFRGQAGTGKTHLINACIEEIPSSVQHVHFNCKGTGVTVAEFFFRTGHTLNWECFPGFVGEVTNISGPGSIKVEGNSLAGFNNSIQVALQAETNVDREERRARLTEVWFADLRLFNNLLLISVDTYEKATTEIAEWISGPFLFRAATAEHLRVLIAGQDVPDLYEHAGEWGHCCSHYDLFGVSEARYWLPVVKEMGRIVPAPDPLSYMAGICHALKGQPADIMAMIEGFPLRSETA